ncbi:hypothetical protein TREMEDRAFT_27049 [Tremella mesenterica DSM 1558]|uniref:uncharacterized protein n=1 Tax=Tremella mesenterica (strain ATCC 24925 / CBS 8224 / DSM 1558 / NBRC 9311 / NRRL Y-6157 / RJB 2259-6 / UBC 559-6) TaxID=578456 RepID=UPI0003F4974E|nr:uncharacterized protein TREMEDRAFT_27049 [Tremella mesenterica DSM 1558]EIW71848.1 hypothetical protein TREMEDRAFT_27049 [Tremella mesenterica DSM 1558]
MHGHFPPVERLQLHLPDEDQVQFVPEDERANLPEELQRNSRLLGYFKACETYSELLRDKIYADVPELLCWHAKERAWKPRKRGTAIGRVYFAGPQSGELYYLRLLLYHVPCPTSFESLRTVDHTLHPTFRAACVALGLLDDDRDLDECLTQAATYASGSQLRRLFVIILVENQPSSPADLWETHSMALSDDCVHLLRQKGWMENPSVEERLSYALHLLGGLLEERGKSLAGCYLPEPTVVFPEDNDSRIINEELAYNRGELQQTSTVNMAIANPEQQTVINDIVQATRARTSACFFLDGPGGCGKTFVENTVAAVLRAEGDIVLMVGSSGICAILLKGGRTAHSRFKIPIDIHGDSQCSISKQSELAKLFLRTRLIIWDEAPMQHRHCAEAVERMLRDVRGSEEPFGGVVVVFAGDFRQCLPVVPKGSQAQIKSACLTSSHLWQKVKRLKLTINMRLQSAEMSDIEREEAGGFAEWLLRVGDGLVDGEQSDALRIPLELRVESTNELLQHVYPNLAQSFPTTEAALQYFADRAVLAPTNAEVDELNKTLLGQLSGESRTYLSADWIVENDGASNPRGRPLNQQLWPIEYLNSITIGGFPLHKTIVKVGGTVLLLRNLDPAAGLCNGTRIYVTRLLPNVIEGCILGGDFHSNKCFIPRIKLDTAKSSNLPFTLRRSQFPIRVGLALTINKAQGQSLATVGLCLSKPVFTHGQLYVGLSRARFKNGLKVLLEDSEEGRRGETKNIVYKDVLLAARAA